MREPTSGQMVLLGLILFAIGVVTVDVCRISTGDPASRWAAHELTGGLFASLPFLAAAIMLPLALIKRLAVARRATTAMLATLMLMSLLWWGLAAPTPTGLKPTDVALVRVLRFIFMPALYVAALYLPSVSRYLSRSSARQPQDDEEVSS